MSKIKVVSLFLSMQVGVSGGAGKVHANIGTMLDKDIFNMSYLQLEDFEPRYQHQGDIVNLYEKFYIGFGIKKIISWFRLARIVKKYCNSNQIDIILGQGDFFFMVTGLSKIFGNKAICIGVVHTTLRIRPKFVQILLARCLRKNDKVISISKQEQKFLISDFGIKQENLTLIHNSINLTQIEKQLNQPLNEQEKTLFKRNIFTYISVGRLTYQKDFRLLIDSYNLVYQRNNKTQLIIIGDGEEYNDLGNYIKNLGLDNNIKLLGKKENPMQYMRYANCFVMSSRFEGYPMVLLEACACGLPLVSVNCPTGPAEVIGDNEGGILVKYFNNKNEKNISSLTKGMLAIIDTNREEISARNKNFVIKYNNKVIMQKWNKYLLSLLS